MLLATGGEELAGVLQGNSRVVGNGTWSTWWCNVELNVRKCSIKLPESLTCKESIVEQFVGMKVSGFCVDYHLRRKGLMVRRRIHDSIPIGRLQTGFQIQNILQEIVRLNIPRRRRRKNLLEMKQRKWWWHVGSMKQSRGNDNKKKTTETRNGQLSLLIRTTSYGFLSHRVIPDERWRYSCLNKWACSQRDLSSRD